MRSAFCRGVAISSFLARRLIKYEREICMSAYNGRREIVNTHRDRVRISYRTCEMKQSVEK